MYLIYQKPVFFFRNPLKNLVYFLLCHLGMQDCDPVKPEFQTDHFHQKFNSSLKAAHFFKYFKCSRNNIIMKISGIYLNTLI